MSEPRRSQLITHLADAANNMGAACQVSLKFMRGGSVQAACTLKSPHLVALTIGVNRLRSARSIARVASVC
jgi:hypothetical protein